MHLAEEDGEILRRFYGGANPAAKVTSCFRQCVDEWAADGPNKVFMVVNTAGRPVGTMAIELARDFLAARQANVCYGIYPARRHQGMGVRTLVLACRYLARHDMADEAVLRIHPDNKLAVAVAHRVGFTYHHSSEDPVYGKLDWFLQAL